MMGQSDRERISMIRSAVLIQYKRVTDGQTDGSGVAYTRYSIYAVARKKRKNMFNIYALSLVPQSPSLDKIPIIFNSVKDSLY